MRAITLRAALEFRVTNPLQHSESDPFEPTSSHADISMHRKPAVGADYAV